MAIFLFEAFSIRGFQSEVGIGSLFLESQLPESVSTCEFDVVAMDSLYATRVHLKLVCKYRLIQSHNLHILDPVKKTCFPYIFLYPIC